MGVSGKKIYTIKEFEAFISKPENSERLYELVNGEIIEKAASDERGLILAHLTIKLGKYVQANNLGRVTIGTYHRTYNNEYNERRIDIGFTSEARVRPKVKQGPVPYMPDLAVEFKPRSEPH